MAIPGAVMFTFAGFTGQLVLNGLDALRVRYVFENEESWFEQPREKADPGEMSKEDLARDRAAEFSRRFGWFDKFAGIKKPKTEERLKLLKGEIKKVDGMLKKVDDEIAALETSGNDNKES
jgi:hypothetical protein